MPIPLTSAIRVSPRRLAHLDLRPRQGPWGCECELTRWRQVTRPTVTTTRERTSLRRRPWKKATTTISVTAAITLIYTRMPIGNLQAPARASNHTPMSNRSFFFFLFSLALPMLSVCSHPCSFTVHSPNASRPYSRHPMDKQWANTFTFTNSSHVHADWLAGRVC